MYNFSEIFPLTLLFGHPYTFIRNQKKIPPTPLNGVIWSYTLIKFSDFVLLTLLFGLILYSELQSNIYEHPVLIWQHSINRGWSKFGVYPCGKLQINVTGDPWSLYVFPPSDVLRMQRRGRLSPFQELLDKVDKVIEFQVLFPFLSLLTYQLLVNIYAASLMR